MKNRQQNTQCLHRLIKFDWLQWRETYRWRPANCV